MAEFAGDPEIDRAAEGSVSAGPQLAIHVDRHWSGRARRLDATVDHTDQRQWRQGGLAVARTGRGREQRLQAAERWSVAGQVGPNAKTGDRDFVDPAGPQSLQVVGNSDGVGSKLARGAETERGEANMAQVQPDHLERRRRHVERVQPGDQHQLCEVEAKAIENGAHDREHHDRRHRQDRKPTDHPHPTTTSSYPQA